MNIFLYSRQIFEQNINIITIIIKPLFINAGSKTKSNHVIYYDMCFYIQKWKMNEN